MADSTQNRSHLFDLKVTPSYGLVKICLATLDNVWKKESIADEDVGYLPTRDLSFWVVLEQIAADLKRVLRWNQQGITARASIRRTRCRLSCRTRYGSTTALVIPARS